MFPFVKQFQSLDCIFQLKIKIVDLTTSFNFMNEVYLPICKIQIGFISLGYSQLAEKIFRQIHITGCHVTC